MANPIETTSVVYDTIRQRILDRSARVCVIGLGYVGLPLAVELARLGFPVTGIDIDQSKVDAINRGVSHISDVDENVLAGLIFKRSMTATNSYEAIADADAAFVCVPTPFTAMKAPDISFMIDAANRMLPHMKSGKLVLVQSTTFPGTTEEEILPILESTGLKAGVDFHIVFTPERINPGDKLNTVVSTPKVVGGLTPACSELARLLLSQINDKVHVVSSPRTAEMGKLLENTFRSVNIALVNELSLLCERMGIDVWEVIGAASTKPFGYMPFYPGPGVGGHCILVDPYYLSWKAREYDFQASFIELAAGVNQNMPYHVVELASKALGQIGRPIKGAKILVLGVAFKKDIDDARNSPSERVIEMLIEAGADVKYNDPFVPRFSVGGDVFLRGKVEFESVPLDPALTESDCIIIVAGHSSYDFADIVKRARCVVDSCNATRGVADGSGKVVRLGAPQAQGRA